MIRKLLSLALICSWFCLESANTFAQGVENQDWKLYNPSKYSKSVDTNVAISDPEQPEYSGVGEVVMYQDVRIKMLSDKYKTHNEQTGKIEGFRIRLFDSDKKNDAFTEKSKFLTLYPDIKADVVYDVPRFNLVAGGYRTRIEADKWLHEFKVHFPGAYILQRQIELPELGLED